jgi:3-deoxy-manno-octulosonate cytidylyltransferase (CMP-KDO synthetase)
MAKVLGIIPARYASSRFPGKMLASIAGKSLVQRTYENARQCAHLDDLMIATDDERIADHVRSFGAQALMTSDGCRTGTDRVAESVQNYRQLDDYDIIVNVQGDEPCINPASISSVIQRLLESPDAGMATAATPLTCATTRERLTVVKCVLDQKGYALYFTRATVPVHYREPADSLRAIGLYAFRRPLLHTYAQLKPTPLERSEDIECLRFLEAGYRIRVAVVDEPHCGVDTPEDAATLERILA